MRTWTRIGVVAVGLGLLFAPGCRDEPEGVAEKMEEAAEEMGESAEEAAEDMGDAVEEAAEKVEEAAEDAGGGR